MHLNEQELEVLRIIENNSRIDLNDLAKMTELSAEEIETTLKKLEEIKGSKIGGFEPLLLPHL